jgi:hypothetical protein
VLSAREALMWEAITEPLKWKLKRRLFMEAKYLPLIPREILFGNPERMRPRISPDGKFLAFIAPDDKNVLQVWMRTVGRPGDRKLTDDKKRGIRTFFWTYDGEHLIYLQDADGDENWHLYAVNVASSVVRDVTPFPNVQARVVALDPNFPDEILVGLNLNDPRKHDVYRINLKDGALAFDTENPGSVIGWTTDAQFQVRAALATTADGGRDLMARETASQPWETVRHWGADDEGFAVDFSADGKTLFIVGSHDANTQRLIALDLASGEETVLAEDAQYDVGGTLVHPTRRVVQAVGFYRDKLEWEVLDASIEADFGVISQVRRGEFQVVSRTLADDVWLVA